MNKQQLAARIWASANEMRSKIEASEYKDYILGFIFYKFLCEKEEQYLASEGLTREDMREALREEDAETVAWVRKSIGYFIAYEDLYSTWLAKGADFDVSDVTDALSAFGRLINPSHRHVFEGVFETLETGLSKLGDTSGARTKAIAKLLNLIRDIPMDGRQGYDVLGYIYEYLISNFAANAGKKAGEFYTPHEVSVLMSEIVAHNLAGRSEIEIYDPTSGSGSLLINIGQAVAKRMGNRGSIKYYAQELKENTYNLTRMNLVMRGILPDNIVTRNGDTLEEDWPYFEEGHPETYDPLFVDAVVSNPPYSQRWDPENKDVDPRFSPFGVAPKSKADYAFLLHDLYHLQPDGVMCIVLPHGVLFRGGEEGRIRENLVEKDHIDAIIGLPPNIFFGTGIPTIVMVLKKRRESSDVLIVDASKGFVKEGKNNKLRASDIRRVLDAYVMRESLEKFSRVVSKEEIRANGYNLNIPRYVDSSEESETWDIYSTMFGGIPKAEIDRLAPYWEAFGGLRAELFDESGQVGRVRGSVREILENSADIAAFRGGFAQSFWDLDGFLHDELFADFSLVNRDTAQDVLAAGIFRRLESVPLVDRYEAYQHLDDAWQSIAVDLEVLQTEGFESLRTVDANMVLKKKKGKEVEVQDGWVGRLLPFDLVQRVLLADEAADLAAKEARLGAIDSELGELVEGLSEEEKEGTAKEALNDAGDAFAQAGIRSVLKELARGDEVDADSEEPLAGRLRTAQALLKEKAALKKEVKAVESRLHEATKERIENLSDDEALTLLNEKWIVPLAGQLRSLPEAALAEFEAKVSALVSKYETTYSDIDSQIRAAEAELAGMLGQLVGSENDMAGLAEFISMLGGGR